MKTFTIALGLSTDDHKGPEPFTPEHFAAVEKVAWIAERTSGIAGATVTPAVGSTDAWGTESALQITTTTAHGSALILVGSLLRSFGQEAAHVVTAARGGTESALWFADSPAEFTFGIRIQTL